MIILGVSFLSDASACLMVDGKIISAISEERLNRKKLWNGIPKSSINKVLEIGGINFSDVDYIATHGTHLIEPDNEAFKNNKNKISSSNLSDELKKIQLSALDERYKKELKIISERTPSYLAEIKNLGKKVHIFEHHQAHAATAFFGSGWEQSYLLTADGWGEDGSGSFWNAQESGMSKISCTPTIDSLGYFYGSITKSLGFKPHRHEGKVLGLAAYDVNQKIAEYLKLKKNTVKFKNMIIANNKLTIFLKNSYILKFNINGNLEEVNRLPSKINTNPIFIDSSILYLDFKNKISIVN